MSVARKIDYKTLGLLGMMYFLWLGNVWLYYHFRLPVPVHVLISTLAIHFSFTVMHEAVHENISDRLWLNELVGILGLFPYMLTPYYAQRWIHLKHHACMNEPEDPNVIYTDGPFWQIPIRYFRAIPYVKKLVRTYKFPLKERILDLLFYLTVFAIYFSAYRTGHLLDAVFLWALPVVFAKLIMDWYINYLPHVGLPPDRYKGTRIVDVKWLTPLIFNHNYHAIHHLWPTYPWHTYPGIFKERFEKLKENGVPIEYRVFANRYRKQLRQV